MQIKSILKEDNAVSPVIGVILMVAITVILAAVIATFVLGLGDQVSNTAPQASFSFDYDEGSDGDNGNISADANDGALTVTHEGGDTIEASAIKITASPGGSEPGTVFSANPLAAGSSASVDVDDSSTVRITYTGQSGDNSATLGKWSGPNA